MGPAFRTFEDSPYWPYPGYNLPFYDVPGCTSHEAVGADPALPERLGRAMRERQGRGDSVVNLLATCLSANAFLLTGEEKYREWVLEYTGAWIERVGANDGIVPDNVGLSGEVGEHIDGKWYGASYGWAWPHGWHSVGQAVGVAAQNAALLTGDLGYMDFPRSQIDHLIARGIERDDQLYVPHKYDDPGKVSYEPGVWMQYPIRNEDGTALQRDGWFEFMPMYPSDIAHLWCLAMNPGDSRRFEQTRKRSGDPFAVNSWHHTKDQGGTTGAGWPGCTGISTSIPSGFSSTTSPRCGRAWSSWSRTRRTRPGTRTLISSAATRSPARACWCRGCATSTRSAGARACPPTWPRSCPQ